MEQKIFQLLKQMFSELGLGDSVLSSLASSLASTGLVTDDNMEQVVASQKGALEAIQKANDKRANDAAAKAKAEADKARAKEQVNEKAESDKLRKEVEKLKAELGEAMKAKPKEVVEKETEKAADSHEWFEAERAAIMSAFEEKMKVLTEGNTALSDSLNALKAENEAMKAAERERERNAFILGKAKELGIPEWRSSEGFALERDATDEAITEHLTKIAEHIRAEALPKQRTGLPLGADGKPDKAAVDAIASRLVLRS